MTISEKLIRAKADLDSVYNAGVEKGKSEATEGVTVEPLEVAANGTYTAPNGVAYSPVKVNVPDANGSYNEGYTEGKADGYEEGFEAGKAECENGGAPEDLNDVLTAQEEKLAELSAILDTKADGYDNGFEDGKKAEYDAFWDAIQENGTRTDYFFGFAGRIWQKDFRPKYSIRPINASYAFGYWESSSNFFIDLVDLCKKLNIEVDFSQATSVGSAFASNTVFTHIGVVDVRKAPNINGLFGYSYYLHTIDKLILKPDGSTAFNGSTFLSCTRLENIIVEGVIGKSGFEMQWSTLLSKTSITSIINALSTTTSGLSITLSKTAVDSAFATTMGGTDGSTSAEWTALIATRSNWTISLV